MLAIWSDTDSEFFPQPVPMVLTVTERQVSVGMDGNYFGEFWTG
jgi:hypothetical protein